MSQRKCLVTNSENIQTSTRQYVVSPYLFVLLIQASKEDRDFQLVLVCWCPSIQWYYGAFFSLLYDHAHEIRKHELNLIIIIERLIFIWPNIMAGLLLPR